MTCVSAVASTPNRHPSRRCVRLLLMAVGVALLLLPAIARSQTPVCPAVALVPPRAEGVEQRVVVGQHQPCPPPDRTWQDFDVTTDFGDGVGASTPYQDGDALWLLGGVHTYRRAGTYELVGTARDRRTGEQIVLRRTVEVPNAPLSAREHRRPTFKAGKRLRREVGRFRDGNPLAEARDYRATVAWGDGSSSTASVIARGRDFSVVAAHRYGRAARRPRISVVVRDDRDGTLRLRTRARVRR